MGGYGKTFWMQNIRNSRYLKGAKIVIMKIMNMCSLQIVSKNKGNK